jgi:hypothetical protein
MHHKILNQNHRRGKGRRRAGTSAARQYSLFDAVPVVPQGDAEHFRRQAQLCQRLLGALHQPELVEMLGRLHEEYEAIAARIETMEG